MAWVTVPGSNNIWEYDNAASIADTYPDTPGTITAGIREFNRPSGATQYTYIKCRKAGETIVRGELNKDFYDN